MHPYSHCRRRSYTQQKCLALLAFTREISKTLACEPSCEPRAEMSPCEPRWMSGSQAYATSLKMHKNKGLRVFTWAHIGSRRKTNWSGRWESNPNGRSFEAYKIR